jgi:hypothetical protein
LPSPKDENFEVEIEELAKNIGMDSKECLIKVNALQEKNPMLGFLFNFLFLLFAFLVTALVFILYATVYFFEKKNL